MDRGDSACPLATGALRDWLPQHSRLIRAIFPAPSPAKGFFRLEKLESPFVTGKTPI
jgi:hypothetical protein